MILSFFFVAVVSLEKYINSKEVMLFLLLLGSVELEGVVFFFVSLYFSFFSLKPIDHYGLFCYFDNLNIFLARFGCKFVLRYGFFF